MGKGLRDDKIKKVQKAEEFVLKKHETTILNPVNSIYPTWESFE